MFTDSYQLIMFRRGYAESGGRDLLGKIDFSDSLAESNDVEDSKDEDDSSSSDESIAISEVGEDLVVRPKGEKKFEKIWAQANRVEVRDVIEDF